MRLALVTLLLGVVATGSLAADPPAGDTSAATKATTPKGAAKTKAPAKARAPRPRSTAAQEVKSGPEVRNFQAFCEEWMQKLRDRETYNTAHSTWDSRDGRVSGEYVGYGSEHTCIAREEPGKDAIGKISYREARYRREGSTTADALAVPGTILEQTDVTEIFRFAKGRWQY